MVDLARASWEKSCVYIYIYIYIYIYMPSLLLWLATTGRGGHKANRKTNAPNCDRNAIILKQFAPPRPFMGGL